MKIVETPVFKFYLKKIKDENIIKRVKKVKEILLENPHHSSLQLKKISCKKEKSRYSIRVNQNYRILFNKENNIYFFHCICSHDEYDRINKDC